MTLAFMSLDIGMTTAIYILSHLDRSLLEDIRHFNIFDSVLDLWAACVYRSCLLLGATIGVAKNSTLGPRRLRASWTVIALVCLFGGIYTMVKLLLFSEVRKPVRDPWFWALFVWTYISLTASFLLWWLLSTVRPDTKALGRGAGAEGEGEGEGFPGEDRPAPEQASGATLQKLLSYTKPDIAFLVAASFFLIVAALGKCRPTGPGGHPGNVFGGCDHLFFPLKFFFFIQFFKILFIYVFWAVPGLCCCAGFSLVVASGGYSGRGAQGSCCGGFPGRGAQALGTRAAIVAAPGL